MPQAKGALGMETPCGERYSQRVMHSENSTTHADGDLSGQRLGGYRLVRRLGSGAMADVYLAEQESLGRQVAVKVLRPETLRHPSAVQRFSQEARAAAALVHGNIVQIHEVACIDGIYFLAEEYVAGPTLKAWLANRGPLDARQSLAVLAHVGSALARSAEQGVVHRDIKPENLLVTPSGEVKVADFGLARVLATADGLDLTQDGMTLGTPLYMSPEQAEGKAVDSRSDLYSLGATVYHAGPTRRASWLEQHYRSVAVQASGRSFCRPHGIAARSGSCGNCDCTGLSPHALASELVGRWQQLRRPRWRLWPSQRLERRNGAH